MKYADKILVLENGRVKQELAYEQVLRNKTLVPSASRENDAISSENDEIEQDKAKEASSKVADFNEISDLTRKTGDRAVYGYYYKAIGGPKLATFVAAATVHIFAVTFSGKDYSFLWLK